MNHISPLADEYQLSIMDQQVLPISRRRDLLLSSLNDSESSLEEYVVSPQKIDDSQMSKTESSLNTRVDELRAYNIALARRLRRMKRRLLLEQALVLAQGPTDGDREFPVVTEVTISTKPPSASEPIKVTSSTDSTKVEYGHTLTVRSQNPKINRLTTHAA